MQKTIIKLAVVTALILSSASFTLKVKRCMPAPASCVIELFTSEGCSSCPPADEAVARLAKEYGNRIHVICFHVDYWDHLGWKDHYSSATFTDRQKEYSSAFQLNSIYTPQVIVNGRTEFVGSDETRLHESINSELKNASVASIEVNAHANELKQVEIHYKITNAEKNLLNIVLVQSKASTNVKNGENEGRTLKHINIARKLVTVDASKSQNGMVKFEMPAGLEAKDCKIIAFTQSPKTMHITGSTETEIE